MIVVSNTSPLTNLAAIERLDLLRQLYGEVYMPIGVWDELNAGAQGWPGRDQLARAGWVHQQDVENQALVTALCRDLDRGESEAMALALELGADLLLLDEREARRAAKRLGLTFVGVLGVLLGAKAKGLIPAIRPVTDALQQRAGFLSADVRRRALSLGDEI